MTIIEKISSVRNIILSLRLNAGHRQGDGVDSSARFHLPLQGRRRAAFARASFARSSMLGDTRYPDHRVRPFQRAFQLFRSEKGKQGCIAYDIRPRGTRYPGFRDSASSACTLKLELHRYFETFRSFMQWKVGVSFSTEHRLLRFQDAPPVFFHTVPGTLIRVCHVSLLAPRD